MCYPYITLLTKFKDQIIIEGCCEENNFKAIINYDYLFDEPKILYQKTQKNNDNEKKMTIFDLPKYDINLDVCIKLYKILHDNNNLTMI